ncbi:MAG: sensor histidine kinase [Pedobacter sp.]|nr:sensor histidine kinase [Pedobacter sp.]MDQ8052739.1 sensor histidine kinase [Pedobacter sp.]
MENLRSPKFCVLVLLLCFSAFGLKAQKQATIDSLNNILKLKAPGDLKHINALNDLAYLYAKTDSAKATAYANRAKTAATPIKYTLGLAEAYKAIGMANAFRNHTAVAIQLFNISNDYYTKLNNKREIGGNYGNIGSAYKLVGNLSQALSAFLKAEKIHREINDLEAIAADLNNLGAVSYDLGNYDKAISYYLEGTKLMEKLKRQKENAQTFINIGNVLRLQKNFSEAVAYYDKAIQILSAYNDQLNLGIAYLNYANIYIEQSLYDKGINMLNQSMAAFTKANFKRGLQVCYNNLGAMYIRQEKYRQAIPLLEKSIKISEEANNFAGLALVQQNIAYAYTMLKEYKLAEEWFNKSEKAAHTYNKGNINTFAEIYNHRSSLDSATGNFKDAFFLRDKYRLIKDSLLNEKLSKQINELNTKYQTEKKETQITLLGKENQIQSLELNKSRLELENEQLENDRNLLKIGSQELLLLKNKIALAGEQVEAKVKAQKIRLLATKNEIQRLELIKRNIFLGSIAGLLLITLVVGYLLYNRYKLKQEARLQAEVIAQQDAATKAVLSAEENERKRISGELHDGIGQMFSAVKMNLSAITDHLKFEDQHSADVFQKTMNLIDESCKEVRVISHQMAPNVLLKSGLTAAIRDFINKIDSRKLKINLETFGLQQRLAQNIETVLYRVIQETVNNVIKHAAANMLDIQLSKDEEGINVMIEDNGKGFNVSHLDKFEGIGLKNIRSRVAYLKGTVDFSSEVGKGTLIAIFIPFTGVGA